MDLIINRRHVAQGSPNTSDGCPAALALRSVGFLDAKVTTVPAQIRVATDNTQCGGPGIKWEVFTMPKSLRDVINRYDGGGLFKVGAYRIIGLRRPNK